MFGKAKKDYAPYVVKEGFPGFLVPMIPEGSKPLAGG